jgi:hypothetical protein
VYYTDAEVSAKGIIESTLRLWYYNSTSATWTKYDAPNGGVDTVENYVWALTNHFSTWGVFGNTPAPATTSNSAGGGGSGGSCSPSWSCSEWSACSSSGIQTRTCTNAKSYCPGIKPATEQSCTYNAPTPSPIQQPVQSIQQRPITETIQPLQFQNTGLTGAVIGVATNPIGIAGIVASLAIIAGAIFFGFSFIPNLNKVKK